MQTGISNMMDGRMGGGQMDGFARGMHGGGGSFLLGGLMTALWAALIVLAVLWVIRNWSSPRNPIPRWLHSVSARVQSASPMMAATQTPLELLQLRYVKGEITREQYETIRRDLVGEESQSPTTTVTPEAA